MVRVHIAYPESRNRNEESKAPAPSGFWPETVKILQKSMLRHYGRLSSMRRSKNSPSLPPHALELVKELDAEVSCFHEQTYACIDNMVARRGYIPQR
jgi:hypothetical protein